MINFKCEKSNPKKNLKFYDTLTECENDNLDTGYITSSDDITYPMKQNCNYKTFIMSSSLPKDDELSKIAYQAWCRPYSEDIIGYFFKERDLNFYDGTGNYLGNIVTRVENENVQGEWIQIELPFQIMIKTFSISRAFFNAPDLQCMDFTGKAKDCLFCGSLDGRSWFKLDEQSLEQNTNNFQISSSRYTKYFRLIVKNIYPLQCTDLACILCFSIQFGFINGSLSGVTIDKKPINIGSFKATNNTYVVNDTHTVVAVD